MTDGVPTPRQPALSGSQIDGLIAAAALVVLAGLVLYAIDWRSEPERLADEINLVALEDPDRSGPFNDLLPADLAERQPATEYQDDVSPQIDGAETTMRSYHLTDDLTVASMSYQDNIWGYFLRTEQTNVVIVDTNHDGAFDRLYRAGDPVYIPDWIVEIADGG